MNPLAFSAFFTAFTCLILGGIVLFGKVREGVSRTYFLLIIGFFVWIFGIGMEIEAPDKASGLFWNRWLYSGAIFIPAFFLQFVQSYLGKPKRNPLIFSYIISTGLLVFNFTPLFVRDVVPKGSFNYASVPGVLFPFFVLYFFSSLVYSFSLIFKELKNSVGMKRNQLKFVLLASFIGFLGGSTNYLLVFEIFRFPPIGNYFLAFGLFIHFYAITQHKDINLVFKKGTTFLLLVLFVFIPSFILILLGQRMFWGKTDFFFSYFVFTILLLAAIFFYRIKPGTEKAVEQLFFSKHYDYRETLGNFSKNMVSILDLRSLQERVIETITRTMGIEKASLFLFSEEKEGFCLSESRNVKMDPSSEVLSKENLLVRYLQTIGDIIIREEMAKGKDIAELNGVIDEMTRLEAEVSIPLLFKGRLVGIINVSHKFDKEAYSHEDIDLLNTLANQTAIAIENARLYEDLKKSKSYMRRADRLASLGTLTAGLAHEIRNPLVAIKTLTQLLPERLEDEEFRNHFLNIASGEVDRISSLVNELLEFARPSDPKLEFENINTVLDGMVLLVSTETKKKGIEVIKDYASDLPLTQMDREQMKQVFLNILLNAIEATEEHGAIGVRTRILAKPNGESYAQIEFKDTGCGIPEEHLEDIFNPFFSTKKSGSGLGLTISNQIVQDHRGYIHVESKLNQETSFFVNLPVNQEHLRRRKDDKS